MSLNSVSENSETVSTSSLLNLIIKSFRESTGAEVAEDSTESKDDLTEQERVDDVIDRFVDETYKFALLSLSEKRETDKIQTIDTSKKLQKADTDPTPIAIVSLFFNI